MTLLKLNGTCLVLALLLAAPAAHAFCRTMSCELGEADRFAATGERCERDSHACVTEGQPLHWSNPCLDYTVQIEGSPTAGIDATTFQQDAEVAFAAWESAQCPGGGSPRFHARFQGFVGCQRLEAVCGGPEKNDNVLMFHDQDWPHAHNVIGLTTPSAGQDSGLVVDTDLELNSQDFDFKPGASESNAVKLPDVLAHEIGHFLGLAHSDAEGALMSVGYESLELSEELLTPDDVAAICTVFPPGEPLRCPVLSAPAYNECQLAVGEAPECKLVTMNHETDGGCSISEAAPRRTSSAWLTLLLGACFLRRRASRVCDDRRFPQPSVVGEALDHESREVGA